MITYSSPTIVGFTAIIVGGFLDDEGRVAAWIVGIAIFVASTIAAGGGNGAPCDRARGR